MEEEIIYNTISELLDKFQLNRALLIENLYERQKGTAEFSKYYNNFANRIARRALSTEELEKCASIISEMGKEIVGKIRYALEESEKQKRTKETFLKIMEKNPNAVDEFLKKYG